MLVLSRRTDQGIRFPELNILIRVLSVKGRTCRLGIDAPNSINVLRQEIADEEHTNSGFSPRSLLASVVSELPGKVRHHLRNELNTIEIGLALAEQQLAGGMQEEAAETVELLQNSVRELSQHPMLQNPGDAQKSSAASVVPDTNLTVLIVEDNDNERELLARLLKMTGVQVATAADGNEALAWLQSNTDPVIVLSDMAMPRCDGAELIRVIRSDEELNHTRVYGMSGSTASEYGIDSEEIDGWFPKPVNVDSLLATVSSNTCLV